MSKTVIGLIAHAGKPNAEAMVASIYREASQLGLEVRLENRTADLIGRPGDGDTRILGEKCELLLVLGGDGTLLRVVHDLGETVRPLFGINLGTLGFLTTVGASDHSLALRCIVDGTYQLSRRSMIDVCVERNGEIIGRRRGLNEAVLSRGERSRLVTLRVRIDGRPLTDYHADGLILSTPTGSTAYSLSAGGPILSPDAPVFVITPICPHVLTNRSLIFNDSSVFEFIPCSGMKEVFLTVDGQELMSLQPGDHVRICRWRDRIPIAMLPGITFANVLCEKLKWSGSAV